MPSELMCSKCLVTFPEKEIRVRQDEQVCPRCHNMLDFLENIRAEKEELRRSKKAAPRPTLRGATNPPPASDKATNAGGNVGPPPVSPPAKIGPQIASNAIAEPDTAGRQWYAVMVFGGDRKAARNIKDWFARKHPKAVGRVLVPKAYQEVSIGGKLVVQYRQAMPGYLLVKCRPEFLPELKRAPHVSSVLPYADELSADQYERLEAEGGLPPAPVAIPKAQVEPFLRKGSKPVGGTADVGDRVRVRSGQWEGQEGTVTKVDGGEVEIEVQVLGHKTTITDASSNVSKLA